MKPVSAPEDLLVHARQGQLADDEERRFEVAVQSSRELELLYDAGVQFDAEASLRPGDEARMAALVERTLARAAERNVVFEEEHSALASNRRLRTLGIRYLAASFAAGLLFAAAVASAWGYAERNHWLSGRSGLAAKATPAAAPRSGPSAIVPSAPSVVAPQVGDTPTAGAPVAASASSVSPRASVVPSSHGSEPAEKLTAGQLFARASEARRAGDSEEAVRLYQQLSAEYPSSPEAEDAKVLIGNLLLSQRSPRAALREFAGYGSGPLAAEALWGQAQALRKLASPDERAVLERLAREYPSSPYASAAQNRLRELAR